MKRTFNILSLSGGGIKGLFQASFLKLLEKEYQVPLTNIFDLIAGTSTGAIVGAAVAKHIPMDTVENLYMERGKEIFDQNRMKYLRSSWYSNKQLKEVLLEKFEKDKMDSIKNEILIPTTLLENDRHKVFTNKDDISIVDAIMSSTAAPFYFNAYEISGDIHHSYVDGGLWANNPTLLAILYAITELDVPVSSIRVLSLGTTTQSSGIEVYRYNAMKTFNPGKIKTVINTIFNASEDFSYQYAMKILGESNITHLCPIDDVARDIELDDVDKAIKSLPSLADNVFEDNKRHIIDMLGYEGRSCSTIKRSQYIKECDIISVGLIDFVSSREEYKKRMSNTSLKDYLQQAKNSIMLISVSLSDAIEYHGFITILQNIVKQKPGIKITISLLNPNNDGLLGIMAPILDITPDELKSKIIKSVKKTINCSAIKKNVTVLFHDTIPNGTYIIIDEDSNNASMIIESRPFSSPSSCSYSYHIAKGENAILFNNILEGIRKVNCCVSQKITKKNFKNERN